MFSRTQSNFKKISDQNIQGPYAFAEYDKKEDAVKALKELNKTNLRGANGTARARIEFSYKRKKNDKLEHNEIEFKEKESDIELHDDSENEEEETKPVLTINTQNSSAKLTDHPKSNCFICKLPGHFAKDCVLTRDSCYECGEKGHLAKECNNGVREAKTLTENRMKAILSQQNTYKFISTGTKMRNIINYINNNMSDQVLQG